MQYRKEIDGLRAIAILPVIFFHGGLLGFTGGFIGVDIFFVISGYLITTIILEERNQNRFSLINFYERRARRILPALTIVVLFTLIAAIFLLPPDLFKSFSLSLISVGSFTSNIFFHLTSGYFSTAADEKPLLHTWSLAVEEQYYIFFPLLILALWYLGKKSILAVIIILTLISLGYSNYLSGVGAHNANFYLILSRAWELFAGSIIALAHLDKVRLPKVARELLALAGLVLIIYSVFKFDEHTRHPSFYTMIPVLGTVMIIMFANASTYTSRMLSTKLLLITGIGSYSLYLWHQPIFAFMKLKTIGEPSSLAFTIAIIITFILSYYSYKYVETPFRNKKAIPRSSIFRYAGLSLLCMGAFGAYGYYSQGMDFRYSQNLMANSELHSPLREQCHTKGRDYLAPKDACLFPVKEMTWASIGDSHTVEIAYAVARRLKDYDIGIKQLSFSACPPAFNFESNKAGCSDWLHEAVTYIEDNVSIKQVIVGFRYTKFLFGNQLDDYPDLPQDSPQNNMAREKSSISDNEARERYWESLVEIIARLREAGKIVYIIYPVPELPAHISKIIDPLTIFSNESSIDKEKTTSADYYHQRNQYILKKLNTLSYGNGLYAVKPFDILCHDGFCPAVADQYILYFDDNHLSQDGAQILIDKSIIMQHLKEMNK